MNQWQFFWFNWLRDFWFAEGILGGIWEAILGETPVVILEESLKESLWRLCGRSPWKNPCRDISGEVHRLSLKNPWKKTGDIAGEISGEFHEGIF